MKQLPVMEIFGPVIQGEGVMAGQQTYFVRFGGCDYRCTWCDSMHAVLPKLVKTGRTMMNADEIIDRLQSLGKDRLRGATITLSGGNPAMHDLTELITKLHNIGNFVAIETQGTLLPDWLYGADIITFSPKPPSSGNQTDVHGLFEFIGNGAWPWQTTAIKIVVFCEEDFQYALHTYKYMVNRLDEFHPGDVTFFIQPGTTQGLTDIQDIRADICNRTRDLADKLCSIGNNEFSGIILMPQLHSLMFGYEKGK